MPSAGSRHTVTTVSGATSDWTFRRLVRADFPLLGRWLATPAMERWWHHEWTPEALERDFGPTADGLEPAEDFVAVRDAAPVGIVQRYLLRDYPEYLAELRSVVAVPDGAASIDYGLGVPSLLGRGEGPAMIAAFVERTWAALPEVTEIVVPVVAANVASWRALEKAGFERVASGRLEPDNPVDDPLHHVLRRRRPSG